MLTTRLSLPPPQSTSLCICVLVYYDLLCLLQWTDNFHLVCDPTIRQPGFDLPRQQWSLLNRFCTEQGHCGAGRRKWRLIDTDLCPCGETQTMSHIVKSCPLTKLNGSLSRLHCADEDAVSLLISYGSWEEEDWNAVLAWQLLVLKVVLTHYSTHPSYVPNAKSLISINGRGTNSFGMLLKTSTWITFCPTSEFSQKVTSAWQVWFGFTWPVVMTVND